MDVWVFTSDEDAVKPEDVRAALERDGYMVTSVQVNP